MRTWRAIDLAAHPVTLWIDGQEATTGTGADALGDPRAALAWLANNHAVQGAALRAGDVVTTGVCGRPSRIATGNHVVADFGALGTAEGDVDLIFAARSAGSAAAPEIRTSRAGS